MQTEIILHNLGLSKNEAKIYLAALETGVASAQRIAEKAGLVRTTGYAVLRQLAIKGYVYQTKEKNKTKYLAESPKNLLQRFSRYQHQLNQALPELEAIYNASQVKPKLVLFEGKEGLQKIYDDTILEKPKEILEFNTSNMYQVFPDFPENYVTRRRQRRIRAKRIAPADSFWQSRAKKDEYDLAETILLPEQKFNLPVEINIYNNKVAFMSYDDEIGLIIESKGIAKTMRRIYELLWERSKS